MSGIGAGLGRLPVRLRQWWRNRYGVRRALPPIYTRAFPAGPRLAVRSLEDRAAFEPGMAGRIRRHLAEGRAAETMRTASMWDDHEGARGALIAAVEADDTAALDGIFRTLFRGTALDGMSHGNSLFAERRRNPYERDFFRRRTADCLLSLGEALGAAALPSYAQHRVRWLLDHLRAPRDGLIARCEAALGFGLEMPEAGSPYVVEIGGRATAPDVLRHAYVAHRINELAPDAGAAVVEIGGGYGMLALLAARSGRTDFTIVDLPFVGCIQFGYLARALGPGAVASAAEDRPRRIALAAPEAMAAMADDSAALVVNCDSLPEMGRETALDYLRQIRRVSPLFLSINQEAQREYRGSPQNRVPDLVEEAGGFRRLGRWRYWMEQGYAEEIYARA